MVMDQNLNSNTSTKMSRQPAANISSNTVQSGNQLKKGITFQSKTQSSIGESEPSEDSHIRNRSSSNNHLKVAIQNEKVLMRKHSTKTPQTQILNDQSPGVLLEESNEFKESSSSEDLKWEKEYSQSNQSIDKGH